MDITEKLKSITKDYKEQYIKGHINGDVPSNIILVSSLQLNLAQELKITSDSIEHEQLIKDLHKDFIDFSTNY
jgi:hypothetical protein